MSDTKIYYGETAKILMRKEREINRLREALQKINDLIPHATPNFSHEVWQIAQDALKK